MRILSFASDNTKQCRGWKKKGTWSVEIGLIAACSSVAAWLCNNTSCNQENRAECRATPAFLQYLDFAIQLQTHLKHSSCFYGNTDFELWCCSSDHVFMQRSGLSTVMSVIHRKTGAEMTNSANFYLPYLWVVVWPLGWKSLSSCSAVKMKSMHGQSKHVIYHRALREAAEVNWVPCRAESERQVV